MQEHPLSLTISWKLNILLLLTDYWPEFNYMTTQWFLFWIAMCPNETQGFYYLRKSHDRYWAQLTTCITNPYPTPLSPASDRNLTEIRFFFCNIWD
jgi:hypothetical protein